MLTGALSCLLDSGEEGLADGMLSGACAGAISADVHLRYFMQSDATGKSCE